MTSVKPHAQTADTSTDTYILNIGTTVREKVEGDKESRSAREEYRTV
jgi:hypothetical protein